MALSAAHTILFVSFIFFHGSLGARILDHQPLGLTYHKGALLTGPISVNLIWYGRFSASQRAIISDFFASLSTPAAGPQTVAAWWKTIDHKYYHHHSKSPFPTLLLGQQFLVDSCPLGKSLTETDLTHLASKGAKKDAINVILTADDVAVEGFCMSRCGTHGASPSSKAGRYAYIWVGNSATQCPGQCAWPFHRPIYGPQGPALVAPNGDAGVDGMVINLASMVAGAVTNPFGNGFYQGLKEAPLEAATACPGVYGTGAYPGYAGELLVDTVTGGSYNANGARGRKFFCRGCLIPPPHPAPPYFEAGRGSPFLNRNWAPLY